MAVKRRVIPKPAEEPAALSNKSWDEDDNPKLPVPKVKLQPTPEPEPPRPEPVKPKSMTDLELQDMAFARLGQIRRMVGMDRRVYWKQPGGSAAGYWFGPLTYYEAPQIVEFLHGLGATAEIVLKADWPR